MKHSRRWSLGPLGAIAVALVPILAGCGGGDDGGGSEGTTGGTADPTASTTEASDGTVAFVTGPIGSPDDAGAPVDGGVLNVILGTNDPAALDPIRNYGTGYTGMNELTAIYDTLMRYDPVSREFVPKLAKSLTANADFTEYTLKLRPDVNFTDGTPLDSAAVKSGFERFSGPGSVHAFGTVIPYILSMETPDPLTVVIELDGPNPSFPKQLTLSFGQVVSPTAAEAMGPEAFNLNPVGAGPFMVESYTPDVELNLVPNPDYWGPAPHLDGIRFTWVDSDQAKLEAFNRGDVDMINVGDPVQTKKAVEAGTSGFGWLVYGDPVVELNQREGYLFADVRLRKAVAYALDPDVINDRAYQGTALSSKALFPSGVLESGEPGIATDPAKARELVAEVKASTGWDGSFTLLSSAEPSVHNVALNVQAMLNEVGFDVVVETPPDWSLSVYVERDFTAVVSSLALPEVNPWTYLVLQASGEHSISGYQDAEMDAAILELRAASADEELHAVTAKLQRIYSEVVPAVWLGARLRTTFWSPEVHGVVPTASSTVLFDEVWLG